MLMRRFPILIALFLFAVVPLVAQQQQDAPQKPAPAKDQGILPPSFAGWTLTTRTTFTLVETGGPNAGDAAAAARNEYGFASGEQGGYTRGAGTLQTQVYRM